MKMVKFTQVKQFSRTQYIKYRDLIFKKYTIVYKVLDILTGKMGSYISSFFKTDRETQPL